MTCKDCIYYERCDAIFDGLLSNRNNELCEWFDDKLYYTKLPAYIGMKVWIPWVCINKVVNIVKIKEGKVSGLQQKADGSWKIRCSRDGGVADYTVAEFKEQVFLTEEAAKAYIEKEVIRQEKYINS